MAGRHERLPPPAGTTLHPSLLQPWDGCGQLAAEQDPVFAGEEIMVRYTGPGDVIYWRIAGGSEGWQSLRVAKGSGAATLRAPMDAKFIDISNRRYPNPCSITVRVILDPTPEAFVP